MSPAQREPPDRWGLLAVPKTRCQDFRSIEQSREEFGGRVLKSNSSLQKRDALEGR